METKKRKAPDSKNPLRNWVFTLNNPEAPLDWEALKGSVRYLVYQKEKGKEKGTIHYQGYIEMHKSQRMAAMKKIIPGAHFEPRMAPTAQKAIAYCMKEDTRIEGPWEHGEKPIQGTRSDLNEIKKKIDEGVPLKEIADQHFSTWTRTHKALEKYEQMIKEDKENKTFAYLYVGNPGTGKSYAVKEMAGTDKTKVYWKSPDKWWDGYTGQETVVLDDFKGTLTATQLQHILDENPTDLETKGGKVKWQTERVFITSNSHPRDWYSDPRVKLDSIMRRFNRITIFTNVRKYEATGDGWAGRRDWLENAWYSGRLTNSDGTFTPIDINEGDSKNPWHKPLWSKEKLEDEDPVEKRKRQRVE